MWELVYDTLHYVLFTQVSSSQEHNTHYDLMTYATENRISIYSFPELYSGCCKAANIRALQGKIEIGSLSVGASSSFVHFFNPLQTGVAGSSFSFSFWPSLLLVVFERRSSAPPPPFGVGWVVPTTPVLVMMTGQAVSDWDCCCLWSLPAL
jgi:hypothetical protein